MATKEKRQKREQDYIKLVYDSLTKKGNTLLVKLANMKIQNNTGEVVTNFRELLSSGNASLDTIIEGAMSKIWSKIPKDFQTKVIRHILKMQRGKSNMGAVLLVKGAGSGKSAIMQTIGVIRGGMTIIVENTQALGSDQRSKIDAASQGYRVIVGFQLDSLSQAESEQLAEYLLSLGNDTDVSIFLFSSPEVLTKRF